jgi:hypothetical protein
MDGFPVDVPLTRPSSNTQRATLIRDIALAFPIALPNMEARIAVFYIL